MSAPDASSIIGQLAAQQPALTRLFEQLGIDYCCGGKMTLEEACRARQLEVSAVMARIGSVDRDPAQELVNASEMSLAQLVDHITQTHHAYLKRELPRLQALVEKITARHSDKNPRLPQLVIVYSAFRCEMEAHMAKEEQVLFPLIGRIDSAAGHGDGARVSIDAPLRMMELEHAHAGDELLLMRRITDDFTTPPGACGTYRATMQALAELETDLHQHVHKENNVLFPRAAAATASRSQKVREQEIPAAI